LRNPLRLKSFRPPAWLDSLTHNRGADDALYIEKQKLFILLRLAAAAGIMALVPVYLLVYGLPTGQHLALFFLALTPLVSIVVLQRTGDLPLAQNVSICGWSTLAIGVGLSGQGFEPVAAMLLTVALIEAALTLETIVVGAVACAGFVLVAIYAGLPLFGGESPFALRGDVALAGGPLLCYAALLASGAILVEQSRAHADRRNARDLRLLTAALGDIVAHFDRSGATSSIVGDTHRAYGLETRDLLGRGLFQRVHVADRPAFLKLLADAALSNLTAQATLRLQVGGQPNANGFVEPVFRFFEARSCPIDAALRDRGDASGPVVCILRDVTEAHRAREEIAIARRESELALAAKTRFLANVSHELRTPLNAIIGFSEMLANPDLEPADPVKRREYAQIVAESGQHLHEVVNTILDISKIESGAMQILPEPFALPTLIDQCFDMVKMKAEAGGVKISKEYPARIDELRADKRACKQIVLNLLSNAVKFTPAGGSVYVRVAVEGNFVALSIKDTGIGISASDLAKLGDPFFQASASESRTHEGTGLGLSVVRGLVGLHGGRIAIESAPKFGTTVTVRLPQDGRPRETASHPVKIDTIARHVAADHSKGAQRETVKKIA